MDAGLVHRLLQWDGVKALIDRLRGTGPLWAASFSILLIIWNIVRKNPSGFKLFSPLSLTFAYGLVGIFSSLAFSPRIEISVYWAAVYVSVPVVLWGTTWGPEALKVSQRIINMNWVVVFVITTLLFIIGMVYVDLGSEIWRPSTWVECNLYNTWYQDTDETLRPTGVGRFAAIAALIAMSQAWKGSHRAVWILIFAAAVLLLFTSGARTAIVGFFAGAVVISAFYEGRRGLLYGGIAALVLVPTMWLTGSADTFASSCFTSRVVNVQIPEPPEPPVAVAPTVPDDQQPSGTTTAVPAKPVISDSGDYSFGPDIVVLLNEFTEEQGAALAPEPERAVTGQDRVGTTVFEKLPLLTLTGRIFVWEDGLELIKDRPLLGYGFHADRLVLREHMHNTYLHGVLQTGLIGALPLIIGLVLTWILFLKAVLKLSRLTVAHRHSVILVGGVLALFSVRTIPESTGALFGVDWLLLAPLLLYLELLTRNETTGTSDE